MRHRISFVGAGNVAWHMAQAFKTAGCEVAQILSRHPDNAAQLAHIVNASTIDDISMLNTSDIDAIIIAVADNVIGEVAKQLSAGDTLIVHTAGSIGIDPLSVAGSRYGVAWPVQSLVKGMDIAMCDVPFCIEGCNDNATTAIAELIRHISPHIYTLNSTKRRLTHLAACMVSNFGNALNALSQEMMTDEGIDFDILRPIITQTARKAENGDLWQQQTGPAARRDTTTIEAQRSLIDNTEIRQLYDLLTSIIMQHCSPNDN